jgi:exodeoxyribonuclease VIII
MNAPKPRTGIVHGMEAAEYHAGPEVSNTMLSAMHKSPAHCYALHLDPQRPRLEPTAAMRAGTLTHTAILEPHRLATDYTVRPADVDYRTKDGKAWRDSQTLPIVDAADMVAAQSMREAVMRVKALRDLLSKGMAETSGFWRDEASGLLCRCRPDWLHPHGPRAVTVLDIKTIADITPRSIERSIAAYGYHRQAAHYRRGMEACGVAVQEFVFGFVSSSYPYIAAAYVLDDDTAEQGADEVAELLARYADCQKRGEWPAYGDGYQLTGLPAWARRSQEIEVSFAE